MEWNINSQKATFILRYYLPCSPICDDNVTYKRMEDLINYCIQYEISAVMLYVDLNPYWYYGPDNIEHTRYYIGILKRLAEKLRQKSISYQLNYQNLIGAWDGGADLRYVNNWENYVDEKGIESKGCACSIGEKFRHIAGEKLRLWAETEPDVIWIDDDIRFHNHRTSINDLWEGRITAERLDFGCFCDKHIALFNKKHHTNHRRNEIVYGIVSGNDCNGLRNKWLDFSGSCADELAGWIERTIHKVSPKTRVAVMTSLPDVHSVEGRNWGSFLSRLSGNGRPLLRPTFGPYAEKNPRDFMESYLVLEQLKANIKYQYKDVFDFCPEIENTRFTRWSKSIAATGYQIMLSAFLGCKGVTLSIYDLEGCVLEEEPEFAELLMQKRPFADYMADLDMWEWESQGVCLFTVPNRIGAPFNERSTAEINQLARGRFWDDVLLKAGIPCRYISPNEIGSCKCIALDKYTSNLLEDCEIASLLSSGVLLDAGAAEVLKRRGFMEDIGVAVGAKVTCIASSEVIHDYQHIDGSEVRIPARIDGGKWNELLLKGAETVTTLVTPYGTEYPGFTRYKNRLGGTVYVYAGNGALGDGFYSNYRIRLLNDICNDISGKSLFKINNGSYALHAVKRRGKDAVVFVANMNADKMTNIQMEAPYKVEHAVIVDAAGRKYVPRLSENKIYCGELELNLYDALICKLKIAEE